MDILKDVTPLNLMEERKTFFEDFSYNPQFVYRRSIEPAELLLWGTPRDDYFEHAKKKLEKYPRSKEPRTPITEAVVTQAINEFNEKHHLEVPLKLHFSENYLSRCRITDTAIFFQLPLAYSEVMFKDLLRHELETHYLRRLNHSLQPWREYNSPEPVFRRTEEGIANLHTHLLRDDKIMRKSYTTYIAVYLCQHLPFAEVFANLLQLNVTPETAWLLTVRGKRGLTDTSQPGCFSKDICYLEGAVKVWQWLMNSNNNPHDLYLGRISLEDIPHLSKNATTHRLKYPTFFDTMSEYLSNISTIGEVNEYNNLS